MTVRLSKGRWVGEVRRMANALPRYAPQDLDNFIAANYKFFARFTDEDIAEISDKVIRHNKFFPPVSELLDLLQEKYRYPTLELLPAPPLSAEEVEHARQKFADLRAKLKEGNV